MCAKFCIGRNRITKVAGGQTLGPPIGMALNTLASATTLPDDNIAYQTTERRRVTIYGLTVSIHLQLLCNCCGYHRIAEITEVT
jgi:hypothetical protein